MAMPTSPLLLSATLLVLVGAPALAQPAQNPPPPANGKVKTTAEANRESLSGAAQAPLRDLNVVRTDVPPVLVAAIADPYARPKTKRCAELVTLINELNGAVGPDIDAPVTAEEQSLAERGRPLAFGAVAGLASDAIPFRGVVRQLTGAARHDAYVQSAITAGFTRRAYLKGLGESRGCKPPATPSHVLAPNRALPPVAASPTPAAPPRQPGQRARYPVR